MEADTPEQSSAFFERCSASLRALVEDYGILKFASGTAPSGAGAGGPTSPPPPRRPRIILCVSGSVATTVTYDLAKALIPWSELVIIATDFSHLFLDVLLRPDGRLWVTAGPPPPPGQGRNGVDAGSVLVPVLWSADEVEAWRSIHTDGRFNLVLHIALRNWADLLLVAPASANLLAQFSQGLATSLASTLFRAWPLPSCVAAHKPCVVAPAMNTVMFEHPLTLEALTKLRKLGVGILGPVVKVLACKDVGLGALVGATGLAHCAQCMLRQGDPGPKHRFALPAFSTPSGDGGSPEDDVGLGASWQPPLRCKPVAPIMRKAFTAGPSQVSGATPGATAGSSSGGGSQAPGPIAWASDICGTLHQRFVGHLLGPLPSSIMAVLGNQSVALYHVLNTFAVLGSLDNALTSARKVRVAEWIYASQTPSPSPDPSPVSSQPNPHGLGGFFASPADKHLADTFRARQAAAAPHAGAPDAWSTCLAMPDLPNTYTALCSLIILGDDLARVNKLGVARLVQACVAPDGTYVVLLLETHPCPSELLPRRVSASSRPQPCWSASSQVSPPLSFLHPFLV